MLKNSFYELSIKYAKKQTEMIDQFTEDAPIISALPMEASTHGLMNVYEELISADSAEQVDFDALMPEVDVQSKLIQENLAKFGATMSVGEDTAQKYGGVKSYFTKKTPPFLRVTGQNMEFALLYNIIRAKAFAFGKIMSAGGSNNHNYSLLIVRWISGENMGLYDKDGFGNGKVFDLTPLNGGTLHKITKNGKDMLGYAQRFATYFGVQIANKRYIEAIANIDLDDDGTGKYKNMFTETQMDDALDFARAGSGTVIYCHPKVKRAMGQTFKTSRLHTVVGDNNVGTGIEYYDEIPIITTRNFKRGTEDNLVIP